MQLYSTRHHNHELSSKKHKDEHGKQTREVLEIINYYNDNKFGVDIVNKMADAYSYDLTTRRWPLKVFNFLIDIAGINAYVLFKEHLHRKGDKLNYDDSLRKKFLHNLANQLMDEQKKYMEENNNSHIYKSYKEASDKLANTMKKQAGLLPTIVKWCKFGKHAVRDPNLFQCDNCHDVVCDAHSERKAYCVACSGKINFDD